MVAFQKTRDLLESMEGGLHLEENAVELGSKAQEGSRDLAGLPFRTLLASLSLQPVTIQPFSLNSLNRALAFPFL